MIDAFNRVSNLQAVTVTAVSTDAIDTGLPNRNLAAGHDFLITAQVGTTFLAAGAATMVCEVISADDAALTSGIVTHFTTAAIGKAALVSGYRQVMQVPQDGGGVRFKRFVGARYTIATGPMTAGTISTFLEASALAYFQYADQIKAVSN